MTSDLAAIPAIVEVLIYLKAVGCMQHLTCKSHNVLPEDVDWVYGRLPNHVGNLGAPARGQQPLPDVGGVARTMFPTGRTMRRPIPYHKCVCERNTT